MATYYVDAVGGSDGNAGTSAGAAWQTISYAISHIVGGDLLHVKGSGTYTTTGALVPPAGSSGAPTVIQGYTSTPGDGGVAVVQVTAAVFMVNLSNSYIRLRNLLLDCNNTGTRGVSGIGNYNILENVTVQKFVNYGFVFSGTYRCWRCRATQGKSGATLGFYTDTSCFFVECQADGNPCTGFGHQGGSTICVRCISANNTGASSDGFDSAAANGMTLVSCDAYGNGRHGLHASNSLGLDASIVEDCNFVSNGGYGARSATSWTQGTVDYNNYYGNTSGARSGFPTGAHDQLLTGDPYTNAAGGDFSKNNNPGAGAAVRGSGYPGVLPYGGTGYVDGGALQSRQGGPLVGPGRLVR